LARTGEVNQFLGLIGLQSIIKAAFLGRIFSTFLKHFAIESRLLFKVLNKGSKSGAAEIMSHQGQDGPCPLNAPDPPTACWGSSHQQ
jgi:hypothetical protein